MKIKQIPEDFRVDEIYDLEQYRKKTPESENSKFYYFILWKRDYTVNRALEHVCRAFHVQARDVHFSGTKDRQAVTTQLISVRRLRKNWEEDLNYFNNKNPDIKLEFVGIFPGRLNLGDNLGNKFSIVIRDLNEEDMSMIKNNIDIIRRRGVLNFFDSQRFGFGGKNILVGKYLLRGEFDRAFFNIITAIPDDNKKEEHAKFVSYIENNFKEIVEKNNWDEALEIMPEWLGIERDMILWVKKNKNDFLGAINLLHKKIRTMYVAAYQSYIFNETIKYLDSIGKIDEYKTLPLVAFETNLSGEVGDFINSLLGKDGLNLSYFEMKRSPTIRPREIIRDVFIRVDNLILGEFEDDDLNEGKKKVVVSFDLQSGSYATNVIKFLTSEY